MWIGGDLNGGVNIDAIGFAPRNDDNSIVPTDIYELFYWDEQWNSLGVKKPDGDSAVYRNVPQKLYYGFVTWLKVEKNDHLHMKTGDRYGGRMKIYKPLKYKLMKKLFYL